MCSWSYFKQNYLSDIVLVITKYVNLQRDLARFTVEIVGLFTSVDVTKVSFDFAD